MQTKAALARELRVSPTRVNEWFQRARPCPLEVQVQLCDIAGLTDEDCRAHLREAAKVPTPKHPMFGGAESFVLVAVGVVAAAAAFISPLAAMISATMYIM